MQQDTDIAIAAGAPETAAAGARLAREGGNAVDVAVGAALAATVSEILMASLGGSAFVMIHQPGRPPQLIDGADGMPSIPQEGPADEAAWRPAHLPYGDGIDVMVGHASVAVPGCLAALELAWKRGGRLPWREVVAPALELARRPFPAGSTLVRWLGMVGHIIFDRQDASRECFFREGGRSIEDGELFQAPHLDDTLEQISREGAAALYQGDLARTIARELNEHGGFVTREDLAAYRAIAREPLVMQSGGFQLALNPPPAVGGAAVGALVRRVEQAWTEQAGNADRVRLHAISQTELLQCRATELAAPDFDVAAASRLVESSWLARHRSRLSSPNTTHLSVAGGDGLAVSITLSMGYGSGITIPGTGIACNNSLGEPEVNPRGYHAAPAGSRLISNMAPTVGWRDNGECMALGSPGAGRITTSIVQTWVRYALEGMSFEDAIAAPRLHVEEWHDGLRAQCEPGIDTSLIESDFIVRPFSAPNMFFGAVKLAGLDADGQLHAIADERRHGGAEIVRRRKDGSQRR